MTDPKITKIINSIRRAGFRVGTTLNDEKRLTFEVLIEGTGEFMFELTPDEAMGVASCLAIPVLEAMEKGILP